MRNVSKLPKNEVFSTELKILLTDFSKILRKHATIWILLILQKLGQNHDFSRSYDVKRGHKSRKITKNQTNWRQSKQIYQQKFCFFIIFFGPRLKTEGSYKITSVRASVRASVLLYSRKPLQQFFWNLAWSRGLWWPKTLSKRIFIFCVISEILHEVRSKRAKNEVFATFLKNCAYNFS